MFQLENLAWLYSSYFTVFHNIYRYHKYFSVSHYFLKIFQEKFPVNISNSFSHISHDIHQFIYVKCFVFYAVTYSILFHSISHDIYCNFFQKHVVFCFAAHFTIFHEMLHTNVRHKSTCVSFSTIVSLLCQGALQNSHCAALPGTGWQHCWPCQLWLVPGLAPLWSQRTAASLRGSGCHNSLAFQFDNLGRLDTE